MLLVVIGYQLIWAVTEGVAATRYRAKRFESVAVSSKERSSLPILVGVLAAVFAIGITISSVKSSLSSVSIWQLSTGLTLGGIGVFLRFIAIRELGTLFRDTIDLAPNQKRVETGPYRFMRHPAEVGFLLLMTGLFILSPGWVSFVLLIVIELLCIRRVVLENRLFVP